ncbi:hypothetical protein FAM15346_001856 [Propionibacterium freudenreichii]|uniref:hypothetical protein n=1 Tax=Propionibacterium freudenreichii TaxID=1744 RepID=UPI00254E019E|nr:hypothetical protein [Propionibacterium freudenreichii]MDK9644790.1 hypothetical protein [Propionibacterium freudenreichii]
MRDLAIAVITAVGVIIPTVLAGKRETKAATTPTYDRLATQINDLWARLDKQTGVVDALTKRVALLERRDEAWQRGWDDLQRNWPTWRRRETPPPYPTDKL